MAAIRTLILVNGAAVVALLTFLGNIKGNDSFNAAMGNALRWFIVGVALGVAVAVVAYLSQLELTWGDVVEGRSESAKATWLRWIGIVLGISATVAFCVGAWFGADAFG